MPSPGFSKNAEGVLLQREEVLRVAQGCAVCKLLDINTQVQHHYRMSACEEKMVQTIANGGICNSCNSVTTVTPTLW